MSRFTVFGAALLVSAVALTGCAATTGGTSAAGDDAEKVLTIGAFYDQPSFNPADSGSGHPVQYMQAVYDSLTKLDPDGTVQPSLATSWSYNDTKTVLTLELRDDVTFSDGTAFTAEAVKANLENVLAGSGQGSSSLASIQSVEVASDTSVTITLTAPDPALLYSLGQEGGFIASPTAIAAGDLATTPVGSGPYLLDAAQTTAGSEYTFTRNPDYWNTDEFPYDEVVIKPLLTEAARLNALKSGQVDATGGVAKMVAEAEGSGLTVTTAPGDWQGLHIADRAGEVVPALADVRVRQAINFAIDAEGILETIRLGYGERSSQIFSPSGSAWDAELNEAYPYDPEEARALLADAGYADGFDLPMVLSTDYLGDVQAAIEEGLGDVGIRVQWTSVPLTSLGAEMFSGKYPVYFAKLATTPIPWKDLQLPISGMYNLYGTEDATVTSLMSEIGAADDAETGALYQELNEYLVTEAWFDPWYVQDNIYLSNNTVEVEMQQGQIIPSLYNYSPAE